MGHQPADREATPVTDIRRLAHDLRNLLVSMQSIAAHVERALPSAHAPLAGELAVAIERAASLARALADLEDEGRTARRRGRCRLDVALARSRPLLHRVAEPVPLVLQTGEHDRAIDVDEEAVERIVINLVRNARRAAGITGSIVVRSARLADADARLWDALVVDNAEERPDPDAPWVRVPDGDLEPGLGLAIVRELTASAGGRVEIWRSPSWQLRVCCIFPLRDAAS